MNPEESSNLPGRERRGLPDSLPGFEPRPEREGVNASTANPLREALLLTLGVCGGAVVLFTLLVVTLEIAAPLIPASVEVRCFRWWAESQAALSEGVDPDRQLHLQTILDGLLARWESPMPIGISVIESSDINAYALPGGWILVTTALLDAVESDRELAFVLAHELGHFAGRDHLRGMGRAVGIGVVIGGLGAVGAGAPAQRIVEHVEAALSRGFDRRQELVADAFGRDLLEAAYGSDEGAAEFLGILRDQSGDSGPWLSYLRTHPKSDRRLANLRDQGD